MRERGCIERSRQVIPAEGRVLVHLAHPRQTGRRRRRPVSRPGGNLPQPAAQPFDPSSAHAVRQSMKASRDTSPPAAHPQPEEATTAMPNRPSPAA